VYKYFFLQNSSRLPSATVRVNIRCFAHFCRTWTRLHSTNKRI